MAIAYVMAPLYLIMGLSFLFYMKTWQKIMAKWSKDHYQLIPLMFLYPIIGMLIIGMYNVWELNVWILITITGWGMLLKGAMFFLLPGHALKKWMEMGKCPTLMYLAGILSLVMGGVLGYYAIYLPMMA